MIYDAMRMSKETSVLDWLSYFRSQLELVWFNPKP